MLERGGKEEPQDMVSKRGRVTCRNISFRAEGLWRHLRSFQQPEEAKVTFIWRRSRQVRVRMQSKRSLEV